MAKCSFGKVSLQGTFEAVWPFGTDLFARMFYVATDETEILMVAMDTADTLFTEAARFREGVSIRMGIPADRIWYHELQLHAAPGSRQLKGETMGRIIDRVSREVLSMKDRAVPFTCRVAEADLGMKYSMNREQYIAGLGGVTVWSGIRFDADGRAYCQDSGRMLLRGYEPRLPVLDAPVYFDNPVDSKGYLFVFSDLENRVIGTISRFAAHPDVAVLFELRVQNGNYHYDFDWPGYLSEKMEREFQAPSLYLNGPCANLATKKGFDGMDTYEASASEARRIGESIADALLFRYRKKTADLGDGDHCRAALFSLELPIRETFPQNMKELDALDDAVADAEQRFQQAIAHHAPAYQIKQLADERFRVERARHFVDDCVGVDESMMKNRRMPVTVAAMQLGHYLFIGLPGECLTEMSEWLRSTFTGVKTIPLDQVNGYFSYMATPTSLTLGGYTYWSSWVAREAIPQFKDAIVACMEQFLNG